MEQYDSYFLQALATTALITALDNPDLKVTAKSRP